MTNGNRDDTAFRLSICACSALIDKGMRVGNIKQSHRMNIGWTPISCHRHVFAELVQMGVWGGDLPHRRGNRIDSQGQAPGLGY